jgi:phosphatidate cytidylyltransferase
VLRQRTISATLIVIATLAAVLAGGWVFFAATLVTALLALDELMRMLTKAGYRPARPLSHLLVVVFFLVALIGAPGRLLGEALLLVVIGPLLSVMWRRSLTGTMQDWAVSVAATLYVGWLAAHAILLRSLPGPLQLDAFLLTDIPLMLGSFQFTSGMLWTLTAILVTWANDTAAFFAGRAWGAHQMAPVLSPKKTWEGAAGGVVAAMATMILCVVIARLPLDLPLAALTGLALGALAQLGDLAESLLKRQTGVKDAGTLIPGHGGVLDRIDSLLFTLPAVYYLATFIG